MKTCKEYRDHSNASLWPRWSAAIIFFVLFTVIVMMANSIFFLSVFLLIPLEYGFSIAFLNFFRNPEAREIPFSDLFEGFQNYLRVFGTLLLMAVYVMLWSLLLFIPGIIKAYSYKMTPYVLKDHPELSYNAAIEESMRLMEGHKMQLFLLEMSFFGWSLLCIATFGIALLWVAPWMQMATVDFYEDLLAEDAAKKAAAAPVADATVAAAPAE